MKKIKKEDQIRVITNETTNTQIDEDAKKFKKFIFEEFLYDDDHESD